MPLRIAVDLVFYTGRKGGTESYARGLFPVLAAAHDDFRFVGIGNRELAEQPPEWFPGEIVPLPVSGENRAAWAAAVALAVGPRARSLGADLLHCPSNFGPAVRLLPTVVTVHDILGTRHPEWVQGRLARGVQALTKATVRAADRIITDSQASADDVHELLGRPMADIDVIHLGVKPVDVLARSGERAGRPYVLAGGNRMRHKNFDGLLEAWALIPAAERPKLVITGSHGDDPLRPVVERLGLGGDVELREWVSADELAALYDGASAYAFPTLFEGFGLPVLEAMARGCPVIGSDIPVLHEVGGDDMAYFDPRDPAAIATAVRKVVGDPDAQAAMAAAGRKRAETFTWQRTADATAEVYRSMARTTARTR
ncbi:glycosyltransferase involved in cell wall biosynthesis [Saccharothrix ecbatanensis]|uniref:Glycosyltransferase involved in cell wall biosynthesis n=1 Tax=Saccharothrix ecbatanensis TaxID=1105145 RepID=A0A7W9M4F0_9PSEU|nr:glycosyltransferase family 1 protein [Saccharothrix ecbatanensis]MBB5806953.1 glycosyltransferase involved in cell wall biosynthesis [Saccharothrix ecbatanensis]